jgi:hypothetical protein
MKAWRGFTLTGEEAGEEPNEQKRTPKNYLYLSKTT